MGEIQTDLKKKKKEIKQHKKEQEEKIVVEIENLKSKKCWKKLKQLANSQKKKKFTARNEKQKKQQVTREEMLAVWAKAFASLGQKKTTIMTMCSETKPP